MPDWIGKREEVMTDKAVLEKYQKRNVSSTAYDVSSRLFNSPFSFLPTADLPINKQISMGRKYLECISSSAAIAFLLPGTADYMPGESKAKKEAVKNWLTMNNNESFAFDELKNNGVHDKYFDFVTDYAGYMNHVNIMCRACAVYLDLGDEVGPNGKTKLKYYNWHNFKYKNETRPKKESNSIFEKIVDAGATMVSQAGEALFGDFQYTQFYVDVNQSISESFSNSTTPSKLKGVTDAVSDGAKEISFFMNAGALHGGDELVKKFGEGLEEIAKKLGSDDGLMSRIAGTTSTVIQGANMIFPEIWSDFQYNKTYNLSFNLVTPYGDKMSMYLNIYVPLMHLLCYVLPRQLNANAYTSPYLIRAFAKGWFSCQMGIVESLTIERGDEWSVDGLPTNLKINMSIRDLYNDLMITSSSHPVMFFSNPGLTDFLGTLCGVDLSKPVFLRQLDLMSALVMGKISPDMWIDRGQDKMLDGIRNIANKLWSNIF